MRTFAFDPELTPFKAAIGVSGLGFPTCWKDLRGYSAATRRVSAGSTFAAQNLNSGILPNGSSAGLVRMFAAASTKANGMNTTPSGMAVLTRIEFDFAAARGHAHHVARLDSELGKGGARE